ASTFYIVSLSLTKVANTLIVLSTSPFLTALLAWVVLGEQVRTRTWVAIAAAIGGISLMVAHSATRGYLMGGPPAFVPPLVVPSRAALIGGAVVLLALMAHALLDARDARSVNAPV